MGIIRRRDNGKYYCDGHYCGFPLAWFACGPEDGADGEWVCLDCSASIFASAPPSPTPHDIAALAETRRRDPNLAMALATEAGRQADAAKPIKEKQDERQGARNTNAR